MVLKSSYMGLPHHVEKGVHPVQLLISVDTEEDNWVPSRSNVTVDNIRALPKFHETIQQIGMKATYFTAYEVTRTPWAAEIMQDIESTGGAELGSHLHPWNTPPLSEPLTGRNTMTRNLPAELQRLKLMELTELHRAVYGAGPVSFRAGRFGFGPALVAPLLELGYRVDSSVTPYWSWKDYDDGPDFSGAPVDAYALEPGSETVLQPALDGKLLEVPLSCGYSRNPFEFWDGVHRMLRTRIPRKLRFPGIAWRTGILRRVFLSPEIHDTADMLTLSRRLVDRGAQHLQLMIHSSSLKPGLTPFTATSADVDRLVGRIQQYIEGLTSFADPVPATLSEMVRPADR